MADKKENDIKEIENNIEKEFFNIEQNENIKVKQVHSTKDEVENKDIKTLIADRKWKVYEKIVDSFNERTDKDNVIKDKYSKWLFVILVIQLVALDLVFFLKGMKKLDLSDNTLNIFITASIAEIFALVTIIVRYLFTDKLTNLLGKILSDEDKNEKKDKKD
jgi:hypothetical protein